MKLLIQEFILKQCLQKKMEPVPALEVEPSQENLATRMGTRRCCRNNYLQL